MKKPAFTAVMRLRTGHEIAHVATGAKFCVARTERGLSQADIARATGYSRTYVCDLESGKRNWDAELVACFAAALASHSAK